MKKKKAIVMSCLEPVFIISACQSKMQRNSDLQNSGIW